jgi:hypothetical protein
MGVSPQGGGRGDAPVPVHVGSAEGEAVVEQGGVDHGPVVGPVEQVAEVAQVSVTPPDPVPGAVLVQHKHLAWAEPPLWTRQTSSEPQHDPGPGRPTTT